MELSLNSSVSAVRADDSKSNSLLLVTRQSLNWEEY